MKFFWLDRQLMSQETGGEGSASAGGAAPDASTEQPPASNTSDKPSDPEQSKDDGLSSTEAALLKDVMKWKNRFKGQEEELTSIRSELNSATALKNVVGDLNEEDLKALIDGKRDKERQDQESRGEYESIVGQMRDEHAKEIERYKTLLTERDGSEGSLKEQLQASQRQIGDLTIGRQFSDSEFIRDRSVLPPAVARQVFGAHFEVENGAIVAYDKAANVEGRAPLVNAQGNKLGFEAAIERLITSHPNKDQLMLSMLKAGAGSSTASGKSSEPSDNLRGVDLIKKALVAKSN
ncbi:MAG: DUF6651 domain-containing protein [Vibrio splendidus]